jgi:uncharacterized membrane protein YeaQ/YmgE (transglycosylase-associated protein family)
MLLIIWIATGALGGWLYGKFRESAMGPLGDALLGLGGGLAGGVLLTGLGLGGWFFGLIGGLGGGALMVLLIGKLKDSRAP